MKTKIKLICLAIILLGWLTYWSNSLIPCNHVDGITIEQTLFKNQSFWENYNYRNNVSKTLQGNKKAFVRLIKSDCGGGAGCYEHGEVLTNILLRMGEKEFFKMVKLLNYEQTMRLCSLLAAGFEYGTSSEGQKLSKVFKEYPEVIKLYKQHGHMPPPS